MLLLLNLQQSFHTLKLNLNFLHFLFRLLLSPHQLLTLLPHLHTFLNHLINFLPQLNLICLKGNSRRLVLLCNFIKFLICLLIGLLLLGLLVFMVFVDQVG